MTQHCASSGGKWTSPYLACAYSQKGPLSCKKARVSSQRLRAALRFWRNCSGTAAVGVTQQQVTRSGAERVAAGSRASSDQYPYLKAYIPVTSAM
jgi:hypothetical protein